MCLRISPREAGESAFFIHVATLLGRVMEPEMEAPLGSQGIALGKALWPKGVTAAPGRMVRISARKSMRMKISEI